MQHDGETVGRIHKLHAHHRTCCAIINQAKCHAPVECATLDRPAVTSYDVITMHDTIPQKYETSHIKLLKPGPRRDWIAYLIHAW